MSEVLIIAGPTAVGKTDLAGKLAEHLSLEVVNADALQVYRELEIGTAKPSAAVRSRVPHHLIDILDPDQPFSAGEFARRAGVAIDDIQRRGSVPVVAGGSGFYLQALVDGLASLPPVPAEVRSSVQADLSRHGAMDRWRKLQRIDPVLAGSLQPADSQRVSRGLEVYAATGKTLTEWHRSTPTSQRRDACWLGLTLPRETLYDRIGERTEHMLRAGWLDEVRDLTARYGTDAPAFQAIGYRTLIAVLDQKLTLEEAVEAINRDTRHYAKRQLTWFRRDSRIHWIEPGDVTAALKVWQGTHD